MTIQLGLPENSQTDKGTKPRITVIGVGGAGGNAVNNMIAMGLQGVDFAVANTDAQALFQSQADRRIQLGESITEGLGAGSRPDIGKAAAEEALEQIVAQLAGSHMVFITAGMGGGTGTGATPVVARAARDQGMLTVAVVTKPFQFEGRQRMRLADEGMEELQHYVDTLIVIPNQNLFRVANDKTTFADAFKMADDVLHAGVRGITDLMVQPGLINLDFADVRMVMSEMGKAMMGTGEAEGERRALDAAEAAIANPLLDEVSMAGARGVLINVTGSSDMTLLEVDQAANRIRDDVDPDANIIFGAAFDESLGSCMRVSLVATGIEAEAAEAMPPSGRPPLTAIEGGQSARGPGAGAPIVGRAGQHALAVDAAPQPHGAALPGEQARLAHGEQPQPAPVVRDERQQAAAAPPATLETPAPQPARAFSFLGRARPAERGDAFIAPAPAVATARPQERVARDEAPRPAAAAPHREQPRPAPAAREERQQAPAAPRPRTAPRAPRAANMPAARKPSLFERVTGAGRKDSPRQEPALEMASQQHAPVLRHEESQHAPVLRNEESQHAPVLRNEEAQHAPVPGNEEAQRAPALRNEQAQPAPAAGKQGGQGAPAAREERRAQARGQEKALPARSALQAPAAVTATAGGGAAAIGDDVLDIPAFLRRHRN